MAARIRGLETAAATAAIAAEITGLGHLDEQLARITPARYGKYQRLLTLLRDPGYGWRPAPADRLVIFSERIETLRFLAAGLSRDLRLPPAAIAILHGGLPDIDQQALVEAFGQTESPLRVLLCSDVAAEGLNLHYLSHRLIHFDIPWSLMVFQQRNGRVDRYGQSETPIISYLLTASAHPQIGGDLRILEILERKDRQAYENIGDPSVFMNVYDSAKEEALTAEAMATGMSPEAFDATYQPKPDEGENLLDLFLAITADSHADGARPSGVEAIATLPSLFPGDFEFAKAGLSSLTHDGAGIDWQADDRTRRLMLTAPADLQVRLPQLPREVWPEQGRFVLTDDRAQIRAEAQRCRQDETAWPKLHYLWPQHVVMDWLIDRLRVAFGRRRAPVIRLPEGDDADIAFLLAGTIPNRKGQPLVVHWLVARYRDGRRTVVEDLAPYLDAVGLGTRTLPNAGAPLALAALQALLPDAVAAARAEIVRRRDGFDQAMQAKLSRQLQELARLRQRQFEQLELQLGRSEQAPVFKEHRRLQRTREIDTVFTDYQRWIEDTLTTERTPHLQVIAALIGGRP